MDHLEFNKHTSNTYNEELEDIRNMLLNMGGMVEKQVQKAIQSLLQGNAKLAKKVIKKDLGINAMEVKIDEECTQIIAKRQPAASDLRLIIAVIKSITDLERIGDEAEKIAKSALYLITEEYSGEYFVEFEKLGNLVIKNLTMALNALARLDAEEALKVAKNDDLVDSEFEKLNNEIITYMSANPVELQKAVRLSWSSKALEKIGDHTKNICEYVIYLVKGKDVRHIDIETIKEEYF
ncbi:MAG: phosphate signaling complex protein PhoU [Alcanivoracaceae bacterium]|nr:phosphate signaling complex protein PhoU [Alcanivoracaceae bacterium]